MNDKIILCEWPDPNCKDPAAYLVRFFIEETGQFSRPLAFCPKHFTMYQAEERKIEEEVQG